MHYLLFFFIFLFGFQRSYDNIRYTISNLPKANKRLFTEIIKSVNRSKLQYVKVIICIQVLKLYLHYYYYCHHQHIHLYAFVFVYMRERNVGLLCCSPNCFLARNLAIKFSWTFLMLLIMQDYDMIFDATYLHILNVYIQMYYYQRHYRNHIKKDTF